MIYTKEDRAAIWLASQGLSNGKRNKLCQSVDYDILFLQENLSSLREKVSLIVGEEAYLKMYASVHPSAMQPYYLEMEKYGVTAITIFNELYPERLKEIKNPPLVLYAKGILNLLKSEKTIAIVGTREPDRYGIDVTEEFATELTNHGYVIVSGMARGIDSIAHRIALKFGNPTIAVMGCGLDRVYPAEFVDLFNQIVDFGLVLSEYPIGTPPHGYNFPERNRIISGLSQGLLITQAGEGSGALITFDYAIDQGRDVFIVPGSVYNKQCVGSNSLLKSYSGCGVQTPWDIISETERLEERSPVVSSIELDVVEEKIVKMLEERDMHIEEIIRMSGLPIRELTSLLLKLELLGLVKRLSGNYYGA